jgi:hypothetical protein
LRRLPLTIGVVLAACGAATGVALAGSHGPVLSPYEILNSVRESGLGPTAMQPIRRGPYYVLHAIDPSGVEMRVVADAQLGDILSVRPVRPWIDYYVRAAVRGPHIINVRDSKDPNDTVDEAPAVGTGFPKIISVEPPKAN